MRPKSTLATTLILAAFMLFAPFAHAARFVDNGNGTVTDTRTGLIWEQKTDDGGARDLSNTYTWQEALDYCNTLVLAGQTDWRLPNIKELASFADLSSHNPAIDPVFENYTFTAHYWSSTTYAYDEDYAWGVHFSRGSEYHYGKSVSLYVRAVRGGQGGALDDSVISETIRFTPFHPTTDATPSPIMQGGKVVRWYRILSPTDDAPLANRVLCYRFSKDGAPIADFTGRVEVDDQGS